MFDWYHHMLGFSLKIQQLDRDFINKFWTSWGLPSNLWVENIHHGQTAKVETQQTFLPVKSLSPFRDWRKIKYIYIYIYIFYNQYYNIIYNSYILENTKQRQTASFKIDNVNIQRDDGTLRWHRVTFHDRGPAKQVKVKQRPDLIRAVW
jgi:hypothetical protein